MKLETLTFEQQTELEMQLSEIATRSKLMESMFSAWNTKAFLPEEEEMYGFSLMCEDIFKLSTNIRTMLGFC